MTTKSAIPALGSRSFTPECPIAYSVAQSNLKTSGSQTKLSVSFLTLLLLCCSLCHLPPAQVRTLTGILDSYLWSPTDSSLTFLESAHFFSSFTLTGSTQYRHTHSWIIGAPITAPSHYLAMKFWARDTTSLCFIVLIWKQRMTTVTTSELLLYM